ncbi:Uncharacterised protein [Streptococcus suis]|uniref:Uncharacterized protein n=3 Tax=Streptococcus suis TaxID=1307 RepID=A0A0Z8F286_STRSU|nr:hypothetical protein [Streptococcus suis]NQP51797.1 hypothetical protein [Streptococcus suis]CYU72478.1 Uncharacterised protein [Streptococcus suis]CYU74838.1 Uncharacterised protein [Streptococcus suis]CYV65401.1 Uncharacterised protein [Streptococcus suis]
MNKEMDISKIREATMVSYLYLVYKMKLKSKIRSIQNFLKIFQQLNPKFLIGLLLIHSIFKFMCSIVTILVLEETFQTFNNRNLVTYVLLFFLYVFSREDVEKTNSFLKKMQWTYLVSPLSKYKVSFYLWVIPSILNIIMKLDVTLPFISYVLYTNKFFGFFLMVSVVSFALIQNISKLSDYLTSNEKKEQILITIMYKLLGLLILLYFIRKVVEILCWLVDTLKSLLGGIDYKHINEQFEENLKNFFTSMFLKSEPYFSQYLVIGALILLFVTVGYCMNINSNVNTLYFKKSNKVRDEKKGKYLIEKLNLSFIQKIYFNQLKTTANLVLFLIDNSEIYLVYYVIYLVGKPILNHFAAFYMLIAFFIILNSNIIHSFVIKDQDIYRNYCDINRITYWKLSNHTIINLCEIKGSLLSKVAIPLVIEQILISYIVSLLIAKSNMFILCTTIMHIVFYYLSGPLIKLHTRLSIFMVPYVFSKYYKTIKYAGTSEFEFFIYDKIYNFYKLPIVLLALLPLTFQLFFDIFNLFTMVVLGLCFVLYYNYIVKESHLFMDKGKVEYEKICI